MPGPQSAQCPAGLVRQRHQPVLVALAAPDVDLVPTRVNIPNLQRQRLTQAQAHRIGGQHEYPEPQPARRPDQALDLCNA